MTDEEFFAALERLPPIPERYRAAVDAAVKPLIDKIEADLAARRGVVAEALEGERKRRA